MISHEKKAQTSLDIHQIYTWIGMWRWRQANTVSSTEFVLGRFRAGRNKRLTNRCIRPASSHAENTAILVHFSLIRFGDGRLVCCSFYRPLWPGHHSLSRDSTSYLTLSVNTNKERKKEIILVTNFHLLTPADQAGLGRYRFGLDGFSLYHATQQVIHVKNTRGKHVKQKRVAFLTWHPSDIHVNRYTIFKWNTPENVHQ